MDNFVVIVIVLGIAYLTIRTQRPDWIEAVRNFVKPKKK